MALTIHIVEKEFPSNQDKSTIDFGYFDALEQLSLFFKDLGIKTTTEFVESGGDRDSYWNYLDEQYLLLEKKYPMIYRLKEYYEDAFFSKEEIGELTHEIETLAGLVKHQLSKNLLNQLLNACKIAKENQTGLVFLAD